MSAMSEMETNSNQKVSCVANYPYDASEPDELTIRPGDMLRDVDRLPGGWWMGELRGRRGMFPDNFVSVLTEPGVAKASGGGVQGRCRAVFSYQPANPDELPLCVGDVLEVLGEVEEGWWQGRRQGRVGVFPSNFVVMLDPPPPAPPTEPAPALPPKPVKEQCRVLFPYSAVNEDELTLSEGDIVTIVSKDAPDRGWWRGELQGRVGLFPDNFVHLLPFSQFAAETEAEKKPERPPSKANSIYPVLNKYSEKTASVKELTTSKTSLHKENTLSKETSTQSTVTHTNKNESEKLIHSETVVDGTIDGQIKKPPVPLKKSPTPTSGVGGLFSGLKSKMLSSSDKEKEKEKEKEKDKEKEKEREKSSALGSSGSGSGSSGEWDRPDGGAGSKPPPAHTSTFDHVERNTILSDPRAGRVKAPRRRPPSQALRDDTPQQIGLSNGHEVPTEKPPPPTEKPPSAEEIKPRAREWEKHRAPWMAELKLNQAKKTSFVETKSRSVSGAAEPGVAGKGAGGSTDRILDCGLEDERKRSTHSMEMSKSTSSISSRISVLESFEETKVRHSLDSHVKKDVSPSSRDPDTLPAKPPALTSPTAAGRTLVSMLEEVKKPPAPSPPLASVRTSTEITADKSPNTRTEKVIVTSEKASESSRLSSASASGLFDRTGPPERTDTLEDKPMDKGQDKSASNTLERRLHGVLPKDKSEGNDALIAQLNNRISNLEKLLEVQNTMFKTAIEELSSKLKQETDKRQALQIEVEKLAHCVTQV